MEVKRDILWRVYLCFIAVTVVCFVIIAKAFYIQQMQGSYWRSMSDSLHQKIQEIDADRGTIYSEDGQMLSTSIPQFDVYIDFAADGLRDKSGKLFKENLDSLSYCLAKLFKDKSKTAYKKILNEGYRQKDRYFFLKRRISFRDYQELREFPLIRSGRNKSGFIAEVRNMRLNPYRLLAYRTIGLDRENAQKVGLEQTYDSTLKGTTGKRLVRYIGNGVSVPVDENFEIEPENGKDIITTLDVHMQEIVENALMKMMDSGKSVNGTCIVMETKTGKIKAIANLGARPDGSYWEDYNYALRTTEPGSTIKLATLLAVLSEGRTTVNDLVEVGSTGSGYVGVRNVNDAERAPKPIMTVKECFAHSSNVGMSKIAYNTFAAQPLKFLKYLHQFRLDTLTGIDLKGEEKPQLPKINRSNQGLHAMVTMSFGYAIELSPLQTLTLYNAIANNGVMMKPYLVSRIQNNGIMVKEFMPAILTTNFCNPSVVRAAQDCMYAVTTEGTAKNVFKNSTYPVAGKTGTAHVADGKYGYDDGVYQASFVGYFPANNPQFTCIVVIKTKPHAPLHFGGQLAAPVFKEISDRLYTLYVKENNQTRFAEVSINDSTWFMYQGKTKDIKQLLSTLGVRYIDSTNKTNDGWIKMYRQSTAPVTGALFISSRQMPSLTGLGLKDALTICENMGLKVGIKGRGKVMSQSIVEGQAITKGQAISIQLN